MKKGIKILVIIFMIIAISGVSYMYMNQGIVVETMGLEKEYVSYYFTEDGVVGESDLDTFSIYPSVSGEVESVNVAVGDEVQVGDVIGVVKSDSIDIEVSKANQQINGYEAQIQSVYTEDNARKSTINSSIDELQSQIAILDSNNSSGGLSTEKQSEMQELVIENTKIQIDKLNEELVKQEVLYNNGIISKEELEEYKKQIENLETELSNNEKQLEIIKTTGDTSGTYESTKASLNSQISNLNEQLNSDYVSANVEYYNSLINITKEQINLLNKQRENLTVMATSSGVISELPMAESNVVSQSSPVAILENDSNNLIESYITTKDIDSIEVGSSVNIIVDKRGGDETYKGVVHEIDDEAVEQVNSLGLIERKIKVIIAPEEELNLIDGFDVDIEYLLYESDDEITVPKESVFDYEDGYAVYLVEGEFLKVQPITKGIELRSTFVVTDGLTESDVIVRDATVDNIEDGAKVVVSE